MPGYELWSDKERKEVNDVLETGILMRYGFDGPRKGIWKSKELEEAICKTFESKYTQLTSSGTSALTTAMSALGIGYGDEIICPTFTFVASFEAILSVGAVPVFVDVDDTLTLNPDAVRKAITPKTNTGTAPTLNIASKLATNVNVGQIISSPYPISNAHIAVVNADVPLEVSCAYLLSNVLQIASSSSLLFQIPFLGPSKP